MLNLIGITGPARHGKDTVGRMLLAHMPAAIHFAFADKIKEFLKEAFESGETIEQNKEGNLLFMTSRASIETAMLNTLHSLGTHEAPLDVLVDKYLDVLRSHHPSMAVLSDGRIYVVSSWRKLCQITGTEWGRQQVAPDFWVEPYLPSSDAVVTDVRGYGDDLPNLNLEAISIIKRGGVVVKVIDPRKESPQVRSHSSEVGIEDIYIAHTFINDGSLEELEDKVKGFLTLYLTDGV